LYSVLTISGPQIPAGTVTSIHDGQNLLYTIAKHDTRPESDQFAETSACSWL
jgi:hypothetical protein